MYIGLALTSNNPSALGTATCDIVTLTGVSARKPGDANGDGAVNGTELSLVNGQFGRSSCDAGYEVHADLDGKARIDATDLGIVTRNQGN